MIVEAWASFGSAWSSPRGEARGEVRPQVPQRTSLSARGHSRLEIPAPGDAWRCLEMPAIGRWPQLESHT